MMMIAHAINLIRLLAELSSSVISGISGMFC